MTAAAERAFVAKCTWVIDDVGTQQTFLLGTRGFSTGPADTPPNTVVRELLKDPGRLQRELFSGARVTGVVRPSFGGMVFINEGGVLDDWASYGISGGPVELYDGVIGTPFPAAWTLVFKSYAAGLSASVPNERTEVGAAIDFDRIAVSLQSRETLLDTPVATEVYTPADTYVAGSLTKKKPVVLGEPGWSPLVLLDPNLLIYSFQTTAADGRFLTGSDRLRYVPYDGGVPYTFEGFYATPQDGLDPAQSPSPGHYKVYSPNGTTAPIGFYLDSTGPCFLRLGTKPVADLRIQPVGLYLANQAEGARRWTFVDLCQRAGLADVTAATLAPGSYVKVAGNRRLSADETYLDVMTDAANVSATAYGFDRLDRFFCFDLKDPDANPAEPIAFVFTEHNSRAFKRMSVPGQERPVWQVNVSAGQTHPGTVNGGAAAQLQEELTREPWRDQFTISSASVRQANPGAISVNVKFDGNEFADGDSAKLAFGQRYIELYGGRREIFTLECTRFDATTIGLELGARVQILRPRFGCDTGRQFRVVTQVFNLAQRTITFGLWGGAAGPSDAVLGGGSGPVRPVDDGAGYFIDRLPAPYTFAAIIAPNKVLAGIQSMPAPYEYCLIEGSVPIGSVGAADPFIDKVILLIEPTGAGGSTSFVDLSPVANPLTAVGNVQTSTALSPATGTTALFDGTGDLIRLDDPVSDAAFVPGTGPLCIEALMTLDNGGGNLIGRLKNVTNGFDEWALFVGAGTASFYYGLRGSNQALIELHFPVSIPATTLVFVTVERAENGGWYCWLDGVPGTQYRFAPRALSLSFGPLTTGVHVDTVALVDNAKEVEVGGCFIPSNIQSHLRYLRVTLAERHPPGVPFTPPPEVGTTIPLSAAKTLLDLRFDGADAATTTVDSSPYAWPVALTGGGELDTAQKVSGTASLWCNGTGGRAVVTGATGLVPAYPGGDLVIYVRPATVADCVLAILGDAAGYSWRLGVVSGKVQLIDNALPGYPAVTITGTAAPSLSVATWTKVTVRRGSLPSAVINLLVNDVFVGWAPWTPTLYGVSPAALTIGADYDGSDAFHGHIDAVVVALN